jgi:hypothetical protein
MEEIMTQQVHHAQGTPLVITEPRRPGLVTFTGVMLCVLGGFYVIAAITEWANSVWLYQRNFSVGGSRLVFWGFVDFGLALVSFYTAYMLWVGKRAGQILGFLFVGISFMRWMFYIPADPWLAITILIADGLMLYGLAANDEWFASRPA